MADLRELPRDRSIPLEAEMKISSDRFHEWLVALPLLGMLALIGFIAVVMRSTGKW
jgi:hypothetical protein